VRLPRWLWLPFLHAFVLTTRPARSAEKYALIWTPEGSPLAVHTARQTRLLEEKTGLRVEYAMRYGEPGITAALEKLEQPLTVIPLYPQYSGSATGSVADALPKSVRMVRDFHDHPAYIEALAQNVRRYWAARGRGAPLLMSFHGLPKRNSEIYESQCRVTANLLAGKLGLAASEWRLTFQSRFGFADWLQPYTAATLIELGKGGCRRVDVVCPGFVSDCLETLEELGITARKAYLAAGGGEFHLIPCLNEAPEWIDALGRIALA
jgi:ferrochelatase